ncbi:MAG: hypothetical protein EBU09_10380 [Betaproteobacteria bacterium]|nr:hypothetical protein [Betaproteobacteria bacterium]
MGFAQHQQKDLDFILCSKLLARLQRESAMTWLIAGLLIFLGVHSLSRSAAFWKLFALGDCVISRRPTAR